jgi:hypothetical protein
MLRDAAVVDGQTEEQFLRAATLDFLKRRSALKNGGAENS